MSSLIHSSSSAFLQSAEPAGWDDVFKHPVDKDDDLWTKYRKEAAEFDARMIADWTKIVDGVLVYVALFTGVLTAFVISTARQFTRDPATISNDLLIAIYAQLVAMSNNSTAPVINTKDLFTQDPTTLANAIYSNALLFASLAISVMVSSTALTAKLWLVTYSNRVNTRGSPYERAMRRQRAYNGLHRWRMGVVIDLLPLMVLISVVMFGIFIHQSLGAEQAVIGYVVGIMLLLGLAFLLVASFCGAFIPDCPYNSSLSYFVKGSFRLFPGFKAPIWMGRRLSEMKPSLGRMISITGVSGGVAAATFFLVSRYSVSFYILFCFPIAGVFALMKKPEEKNRRPRHYELHHWVLFSTINVAATMAVSGYFLLYGTHQEGFVVCFWIGCFLLFVEGLHGVRMSGSISDTTEADAVAWLLKSTSSWTPEYFEKIGQIAGHSEVQLNTTKALLLKSLLPLLSSLITSRNIDAADDDEGIYVACLAQLANFEDDGGSIWQNNAAIAHPILTETLADRLREIKASSKKTYGVRAAAASALRSFRLDEEAPYGVV